MINYLHSILPRIQQHSKALDDVATFADKEWAFLDDDGHKVSYIFRRNNELLVTKQGEVITGKWEYLAFKQSLLIEHEGRRRMYNQGFLNDTIMLLRKDGTDEIFPLGNVQLLPELDVERYVEAHLIPQIKIGEKPGHSKNDPEEIYKLKESGSIRIVRQLSEYPIFCSGNKVFLIMTDEANAVLVTDGVYTLKDGHELIVKNGSIAEAYFWQKYQTKQNLELSIRLPYFSLGSKNLILDKIRVGQKVQTQLRDGWITMSDNETQILIKGNKISVVKFKSELMLITFFVSLLLIAIIMLIITSL